MDAPAQWEIKIIKLLSMRRANFAILSLLKKTDEKKISGKIGFKYNSIVKSILVNFLRRLPLCL